MGFAPHLANAQSYPFVLQDGVCKPVEWARTHDLGVCDKNYQPIVKTRTMAVVVENSLLDCLIRVESGGNATAVNPRDTDGFEKYGLLQFHRPTFNEWCVAKYGFKNEIFNAQIQIDCALKMIDDGQAYRWPTIKKYCL